MNLTLEQKRQNYTISTTGCWIWDGGRSYFGYGSVTIEIDGKWHTLLAHRWMYEEIVGPIPEGLELDHTCEIILCCNPAHLEPVTHAENVRRGRSGKWQLAKTHCPQDHPYSGENLSFTSTGGRICLECQRTRQREYQRKRRAAANLASHDLKASTV